jgi:hypothetical protein
LKLKSSKSSQIFNAKYHKIARESTRYFHQVLRCKNHHKKYQENIHEIFRAFEGFLAQEYIKLHNF